MIEGVTVGKRYAKALYEAAKAENKGKVVYDDLENIVENYINNNDFFQLINHPECKKNEKKSMFKEVFSRYIDEITLNFLSYVIDKNRIYYLDDIVEEYIRLYREMEDILEVEAIFAVMPRDDQKEALVNKLREKTSKQINLDVKVDKTILGGGILKIGDKIIDGSIRRQFERLKSIL